MKKFVSRSQRIRHALIGTMAALLVATGLVAAHESVAMDPVTPAAVSAVADVEAPEVEAAEVESNEVVDAPEFDLVAYSSCPSYNVGCFFTDSNGGGAYWQVSTSQGCKNFTSTWNDRASSVRNQSPAGLGGYLIRLFEHANCGGVSMEILPATDRNMNWLFNDLGTSYAVYPCSQISTC